MRERREEGIFYSRQNRRETQVKTYAEHFWTNKPTSYLIWNEDKALRVRERKTLTTRCSLNNV